MNGWPLFLFLTFAAAGVFTTLFLSTTGVNWFFLIAAAVIAYVKFVQFIAQLAKGAER